MTTITVTSATPTHSWKPQVLRATFATITVAVISAPVRNNSSRFVYRGRSSVMLSSAAAPRRPSRVISSSRAGETMVIAASAAASSPAIGTSAAATTSNSTSMLSTVGISPVRSTGQPGSMIAPGVEQFVLQPEHLPLLGGFGVVVAEQVQAAVHGEQVQLVVEGMTGLRRLRGGHGRAQHHITQQRRTR